MCRRTYCPDCDQEMIHRDNRKPYESASAFGQIIYRTMPRTFTFGDIDSYYFKRSMRLLRLIEHKQPHQILKAPQWEALDILARAVDAYIPTVGLHPDSGLYVIRGELGPACQRASTDPLPRPADRVPLNRSHRTDRRTGDGR